jgi:hypothetical protein
MEINGIQILVYYTGWAMITVITITMLFVLLKILEIYTQKPRNET